MLVQHVDHLIVGAGFAGLCAAIKLQDDVRRPTTSREDVTA